MTAVTTKIPTPSNKALPRLTPMIFLQKLQGLSEQLEEGAILRSVDTETQDLMWANQMHFTNEMHRMQKKVNALIALNVVVGLIAWLT